MRSLASVLIPRQLQGGSGPEPAATHECGTTASQRARLRRNGLIPNKSDRWRCGYPRLCASCCRQTVRSALSASTLREQFHVMLRTAHSVRARKQSASTEFWEPLKPQSPHAKAGTQLQARSEHYRRGRGQRLLSNAKELFPVRSLAPVLGPRQRQGGSGPEPAANPRV